MPKSKVLIFGGNGLMGAPVALCLAEQHNYDVTVINRGNWYWNTGETVKPKVKCITWDRSVPLSQCTSLLQELQQTNQPTFDAVIDFTVFNADCLKDSTQFLKGKTSVYIYISSDSVYEVCLPNAHGGFQIETDAVRPNDKVERERLATLDEYGDNKLRGEEILCTQRKNPGGIPYVFIRIPDVLGAYDNTYRWWFYQMWVKYQSLFDKLIPIPKKLEYWQMSFVHVNDVVQAVEKVLDKGKSIYDQAFNFAFEETISLPKILNTMKKELGLDDADEVYEIADKDKVFHLFPSVFRGPIDISKAKRVLGFKPMKLDDACKDVIRVHEKLEPEFPKERTKVALTILKMISEAENVGYFFDNVWPLNKIPDKPQSDKEKYAVSRLNEYNQ